MKNYNRMFLVCLLFGFSQLASAFKTVGAGVDCDYNNIFPAYNDSDPELRITSEQVHTNNFTIEKLKFFYGGFKNCAEAAAGIAGVSKSKWSGLNALNNTVIKVDTNAIIVSTVIFSNFEIFNGTNTSIAQAGGIGIKGNTNFILRSSIIYDNEGSEGGGIRVSGNEARLTMENSKIRNNSATGFGGGVFCEFDAVVNMDSYTAIHDNTANFNGGGLFAHSNCQINNYSGDVLPVTREKGIYGNSATNGGGVYLQSGSDMLLEGSSLQGSASQPAIVSNNFANDFGAGIYLTGAGTTVTASNAWINNNEARLHGGGIMVDNSARFVMLQSPDLCTFTEHSTCSSISFNESISVNGEGAVAYIDNGGVAVIARTSLRSNRSNKVALFSINNKAYLRLEGNLIYENDGITQSSSDTLIKVTGGVIQGSTLDFLYNTVVDNVSESIFKIAGAQSEQTVNIVNSIIWDQGSIFEAVGTINSVQIDCSVVHEDQSLVGNIGALLLNNPQFIDANANNYRLNSNSDAIDFCDEFLLTSQYKDFDGNSRGTDINTVNNAFGTFDAGAYEYVEPIIFSNGFE